MPSSNITLEQLEQFKAEFYAHRRKPDAPPPKPPPLSVCRHAEFTSEPYMLNRPCKGKKIICRRHDIPVHRGICNPSCKQFEEKSSDE